MTRKELKAVEFARKAGIPYKIVEFLCRWNSYNVFKGYIEQVGEVGLTGNPFYILEKDGEFRFTTSKEGFEILDYRLEHQ